MILSSSVSAIVTGGASGLGRATAQALRKAGARVAIFDRNADLGPRVADELDATFCHVDITDASSVQDGFVKARSSNGQERILVNCAGGGFGAFKTAARDKQTGEGRAHPIDRFEMTVQLNLVGSFRCIALSAAAMLDLDLVDGERGVIVNTASIAAQDGQIGQVAYSAAKAGIVGMTLPIARDLAGEGIRVNTILPGVFATPLLDKASPEMLAALAAGVPFPKRLGQADEYAQLALAIIANGYLNAECIRLDGAARLPPR